MSIQIKMGDVMMIATHPQGGEYWVCISDTSASFDKGDALTLNNIYAYCCADKYACIGYGILTAYSILPAPANWKEIMFRNRPEEMSKCKAMYPHLFKSKMFTP